MPCESIRTVCTFGSSLAIVIPKEWARYLGIAPRSKLRVLYDSLLIVIPPGAEKKFQERKELVRRVLE
ncbi:MAG: AbrB/MazE/SpoVT family DNA-binding domain-containing protein [Candidatus Hadarchaeales archaeon]